MKTVKVYFTNGTSSVVQGVEENDIEDGLLTVRYKDRNSGDDCLACFNLDHVLRFSIV